MANNLSKIVLFLWGTKASNKDLENSLYMAIYAFSSSFNTKLTYSKSISFCSWFNSKTLCKLKSYFEVYFNNFK